MPQQILYHDLQGPTQQAACLGYIGLAAVLATLTSAVFQTGMIKPFLLDSVRIKEGDTYL